MPVNFTQAELDAMEKTLFERAPAMPTTADADRATRVVSMTSAGGPAGFLLNLQADDGKARMFYLNPVLVRHLLSVIAGASEASKWWGPDLKLIPNDQK